MHGTHPDRPVLDRDVVVVGAGPAGLMAARRLQAEGRSVAVLEARERVGGRTHSDVVDGAFLELGGQWVSPDQTELLALIDEVGMTTYLRYRDGDNLYRTPGGDVVRYAGGGFPVSDATQAETERLVRLMDELVEQVGCIEPWAHPRARELDTIAFSHWLRRESADEEACQNISMFIAGAMLTKPPHAFSTLQAVLMAASAGSFTHLTDEDFILDQRVVGGMQAVSQAMAADLEVHLGTPVHTLRRDDAGVTAMSDRVTVRARHVVVAVPPNLYTRIGFDPPLPRRQHQLHQHLSLGLVIKVHAVYPTPFWREQGLSGTCFGATALVPEIYDNTNHEDPRGTLVAFVSDEKADAMFELSEQDRRAAILTGIADFLGPQALDPVVYYESDWASEEWTRGAYAASFDLGGLSRYGRDQATPVGRVHWAGSDIATAGYQHVDGALRSGRAAAEAIMATELVPTT